MSLPRTGSLAEKVSKAYELFNIFLRYWRRNYGSTRKPIWKPLLTYVRRGDKYNYDLHYLDPNSSKDGLDGVSFYVSKYILKYDDWVERFRSKLFFSLSDEDFKDAWKKLRPRILMSKGFGSPSDPDVRNHLLNGIQFSLDSGSFFPFYISRINGSTYPLSPYYAKKLLDIKSRVIFKLRCPSLDMTEDDVIDFDRAQLRLANMRTFLNSQVNYFDLEDINNINSIYFDYGKIPTDALSDSCFADSWKDFDDSDYFDG